MVSKPNKLQYHAISKSAASYVCKTLEEMIRPAHSSDRDSGSGSDTFRDKYIEKIDATRQKLHSIHMYY